MPNLTLCYISPVEDISPDALVVCTYYTKLDLAVNFQASGFFSFLLTYVFSTQISDTKVLIKNVINEQIFCF